MTTFDDALSRRLRHRFPALRGPTIFFENAGGSQLPDVVIDAMAAYMRESYVQLGAGYPLSKQATRVVDEAHEFVGRLMNAGEGTVILGASTSVLLRMLADCYAEVLTPGREIVVAETGHEANIGPWLRLEKQGIVLRWWRVDPAAMDCRLDGLDPLLNERTALVVFPHVSNLLGAVADVGAIAQRAHAVGARVVVDGVAFAPHRAIDVQAWDADWYVYSTYKVYGPHMAALYGRRDALAELTGPNHFFIPREEWPCKFELGGASHEGCAGLVALGRYLNFVAGVEENAPCDRRTIVTAFERMAGLEQSLQEKLVGWLRRAAGVTVVGPGAADDSRVPTVSFIWTGRSADELTASLDGSGIALRHGHMYAWRLCRALGIDPAQGVIRASLLHYNRPEEVDRLIEALGRFGVGTG